MSELTIHRVDGIGEQIAPDETKEFDPRAFEQAIHGLQEVVLSTIRFEDERTEDDYDPAHEPDVEDGQQILRVQPDTVLHDICKLIIPQKWDLTILTDQLKEHGYAVRASVDCGGGILVHTTIFVEDGMIRKFRVAHTSIANPDEEEGVKDLNKHSSSREIAHLNRWLERSVKQGYARAIPSAATAFDFIATKEDIPALGSRSASRRNRRESIAQKDWAEVRDKTQQTVSDNVREARSQLRELDEPSSFDHRNPAMEQVDLDSDESGDIHLV